MTQPANNSQPKYNSPRELPDNMWHYWYHHLERLLRNRLFRETKMVYASHMATTRALMQADPELQHQAFINTLKTFGVPLPDEGEPEQPVKASEEKKDIFGEPTVRASLRFEGAPDVYMAFSIPESKVPKKSGDFLPILKELVRCLEAPDEPDPEVLGKHSPPVPPADPNPPRKSSDGFSVLTAAMLGIPINLDSLKPRQDPK